METPAHHSERLWQGRFASALLDAESEPPGGLKTWNGSDPAKRFAVYRNNVVVNLVDGLCETFPVCLELVGEEFFRAMVTVFVRTAPPSGPVLASYGAELPAFIERFGPAADIPCLADVARLEWARVAAWHGADATSLRPEDWSALSPDALARTSVVCHPAAAVLRLASPAVSVWAAHQADAATNSAELEAIDISRGEECLVIRPQLEVEVLLLPPGGATFCERLLAGEPFGIAAGAAAASDTHFDLSANLALAMRPGFAIRFAKNERTPQ
jgi:hypothetical protein